MLHDMVVLTNKIIESNTAHMLHTSIVYGNQLSRTFSTLKYIAMHGAHTVSQNKPSSFELLLYWCYLSFRVCIQQPRDVFI